MRRTTVPRRAGFSLIELLTVIAIIATLAALTMAGISKAIMAQRGRATEGTLNKLQEALDQQVKAVADQCSEDNLRKNNPKFEALVAYCDNDRERAKSLWTYMNLKREFPQTFAEATSDVYVGGVTLPRRQTFASVATIAGNGPAGDEAAVLLFLNLTEKGNRGMNFAADATTGATGPDGNYTVYRDSYGTGITFLRWAGAAPGFAELQAVPYISANSANKTGGSKDPLDPLAKLYGWTAIDLTDTASPQRTKKLLSELNLSQGGVPVTFDGLNKRGTVISAGPNKVFEGNPTGTTDDVYGYRLTSLGKRGD